MHPDTIYTLDKPNDTYSRNMTYRYRILNAHYDNVYYNISFGVYYNTTTLPMERQFIPKLTHIQPVSH